MWGLVQPAIAKRTQACAYDRAGLGFSDPANRESSSANIVDDLHRLLQGASINPPFVLVGHSYGGMSMRLYADLYFADVAGMVLVDPSTRDLSPPRDALPLGAAVKMAQDDGVTEGLAQACISAAETGFVKDSTIYRECVSEGSNPRYSDDINAVYIRLEQTPGFWKAWMSEKIAIDSSSADQVRSARRDYGSLPLVVLTQSEAIGPDPKEDRWVKAHDEIASLSTVGVNRIVPDASHMIMLDQPQAVIDAVDDVLDQIEHRSASDRLTR